jgi:hypothetical protein
LLSSIYIFTRVAKSLP